MQFKGCMKTFKLALIYIFLIVQVIPAQSNAQVSWAISASNYLGQEPFSKEELSFLTHYKAYVKRIIQIRASIIKKKIVCLGYTDMADLKIEEVKDEEIKSSLNSVVRNYHHSEECELFLSQLSNIHQQYSEMKVLLGLHKSSKLEVVSKSIFSALGEGVLLQGAGYTKPFSDNDNVYDIFECDEIEAPLVIDRTDFCLRKLKTIINIAPNHVVKKISLGPVDSILPSRDLPEIENVGFLNWEEVVTAVDRFKEYYINSDQVNENLAAFASSNTTISQTVKDENSERVQKYFSAAGYQAQGMYIFSEYPEESAPLAYAQILSEFPVLGFYKPQTTTYEIDCENVGRNMNEICNRYAVETNFTSFEYNTDQKVLEYQFARAYERMLKVVNSLINRMEVDFDSSKILNTDLEIIDDIDLSYVHNWKKLIRFEGSLSSYEEKYPDYFKYGERIIKKVKREDLIIAGLTLAGIVAISVGCGFVSGLMGGGVGGAFGAGACILASGLGVNSVFYYMSHKEYEDGIENFFSNPTNFNNEESLSLIEFDNMKQNAQALMLDTYMFGIGTGVGQVIFQPIKRVLREMIKINKIGELL